MIVRRATSADLPRIGRLGALLIEEHHDFDSRRFLAARQRTPTDYASFLSTQLEDPDVAVLVADHDGDVIGYAYAAVEGAGRGPRSHPSRVVQHGIDAALRLGRRIDQQRK